MMKGFKFQWIKNQRGFTLIEAILGSVLLGILAMSLAAFFSAGAETFSLVKSRNEAAEKARYAMQQIYGELMYLESVDIVSMNINNFGFMDAGNVETHLQMGIYQGQASVLRNNDVLVPNGQSIAFKYYDADNNETVNTNSLRRIEVTLVVQAEDNKNVISLKTSIFPRGFIYTGFQ